VPESREQFIPFVLKTLKVAESEEREPMTLDREGALAESATPFELDTIRVVRGFMIGHIDVPPQH
jgi:hypothetical protein